MELASFGNRRTYDDFKKQIPADVVPKFETIRDYCFSLGDNVVEDIRMHRIVFGKSMSFRWFADVCPQENSVMVKIQKNRKETPQLFQVDLDADLIDIKKQLKQAYDLIR